MECTCGNPLSEKDRFGTSKLVCPKCGASHSTEERVERTTLDKDDNRSPLNLKLNPGGIILAVVAPLATIMAFAYATEGGFRGGWTFGLTVLTMFIGGAVGNLLWSLIRRGKGKK